VNIALRDADAERLKGKRFPNFALMKISAYHKARGDTVDWWNPLSPNLDMVYSSKIFTFTPENIYLPPDTIKGGTGYDIAAKLPPEIDAMYPDYSIYPDYDCAIGFTTRGCPNSCPWCVVPMKEGSVKPYRDWREIARQDTKKIVLMDNNILACDYGIEQLRSLIGSGYSIDINQGMDARLVDAAVANMLSSLRWIKYIRFACDTSAAIEPLINAARLLNERGVSPSRIFVYFLVRDIPDAMARVKALRGLGCITLYAQAYCELTNSGKPISKEASYFAQKYIYSGQWRKTDWYDTPWGKTFDKEKE